MSSLDAYKRELDTQKKAREQAEQRLEQKSRDLYEKNVALQDALRTLQQQQQTIIAQEKQASIGQLSAGLAHEINNPNAFVRSNLETLSSYMSELSNALTLALEKLSQYNASETEKIKQHFDYEFLLEDAESLLAESKQGSNRIEQIVKGLRYFTHPDGKNKKLFNVNSCVEHTLELLRHEMNSGIQYVSQLNDLPDCSGMPNLLSLAIGNLLKNAAEANPRSDKVYIHTENNDNEICICIEDDGEGIAPERMQKILDPFYTTKDTHNGLGLTMSQAIVQQHDGSLTINSEPDNGTRVCIHLPLLKA